MRLRLFFDAIRGCEGRRVSSSQLRSFYARDYVRRNPSLDANDAEGKAAALLEVCGLARLATFRRILEVGCGSGAVLTRLRSALHAELGVGIDYGISQARIAAAGTGLPVISADGSHLPVRSAAFDLAYVADVLEHVLDPVAVLLELRRVAPYVGFLVPVEAGLVANVLYSYRRLRGKPTNRDQYGHIWRWFRPEVLALLRKAELSPVALVTRRPVPFTASRGAGRAVEAARTWIANASPGVSDLLFGGLAIVGVACSTDRTLKRRRNSPWKGAMP